MADDLWQRCLAAVSEQLRDYVSEALRHLQQSEEGNRT